MIEEENMMRTLETLTRNNIPRGVSMYTDFKVLTANLIDDGIPSNYVSHLINILRSGLTLKIDWRFLEDYDRQEVQSRVTRRTMLKNEIVDEIMDLMFRVCSIKESRDIPDLAFTVKDGDAVVCSKGPCVRVTIPKLVLIDGVMYVVRTIGDSAFKGCKSLIHVEMPESIRVIGDSAFGSPLCPSVMDPHARCLTVA